VVKVAKKWKVLIVEDGMISHPPLKQEFTSSGRFNVVGVANKAEKALDYIEQYTPDAVVVDLHRLAGSSFNVLEKIKESDFSPYVLVVTSLHSAQVLEKIESLSDFFYIQNKGYTSQQAIKHLWRMSAGLGDKPRAELEVARNEVIEMQAELKVNHEKMLRESVERYLNKFNIGAKLRGREFLTEAIIKVIEKSSDEKLVMGQLFEEIADVVEREPHTIDTGIRRVLEKTFSKENVRVSGENFPTFLPESINDIKIPTNKQFIVNIAECVKKEIG